MHFKRKIQKKVYVLYLNSVNVVVFMGTEEPIAVGVILE